LDYTERLRNLAINDAHLSAVCDLDPKTLALVRLAALVAVGGAVPSFGAQADEAVDAGATTTEIVDVLVSVIPIVGMPCVVAAAPRLAMALGYDVGYDLDDESGS
jgi:4-carboxymuconolactone decarboxylase